MTTPEEMQICNVIATPVVKTNFGWVCQSDEYGTPNRICGVCKQYRGGGSSRGVFLQGIIYGSEIRSHNFVKA